MKNRILIDWISFSTKKLSKHEVFELIGIKDVTWQNIKGQHGYKDRHYFESISIHYNGGPEMGIWVEMTGKGCRSYESYGANDYDEIFNLALTEDIKLTRLDIAYDDFEGILNIDDLAKDTQLQNYSSYWKNYEVIFSSGGNSIILGSRKSDILYRIYDKKAEQKQTEIPHWIRAELQLRDERALGFIKSYYSGIFDLGYIYMSVVNNYIRYVTPTNDSNKRRWPMTDYWQNFIAAAEKISIYEKPGAEYTLDALYDYVIFQSGNSIDAFLKIAGVTNLVEELKKRGTKPNPKYQRLIEVYNQYRKEAK